MSWMSEHDARLVRRSVEDAKADPIRGRARRVRKNLRQGLALAWAASPQSLIRYSVLGMVSSAMPPIAVYLGAVLVNRIADARAAVADVARHAADHPRPVGRRPACSARSAPTWATAATCSCAACSSRPSGGCSQQASKVDLGHFDNSDWHDRLARAKRDVSWRPGDLTWSVLGLSGNIVTIVLMAALLASLH